MWLNVLMEACIDVAQSEHTSGAVRIICTILISLLFLAGIAALVLLTFVVEGQSVLTRVVFFLLGLGILGYYLQFLKAVMRRRKEAEKR